VSGDDPGGETNREYDLDDVLEHLEDLEETVSDAEERRDVQEVRRIVERVPGSKRIRKYTTRDVAEGFVGAIVFSLPLLVEGGVFEIAEWLVSATAGGIPVFFFANVAFVVVLTTGLLYYADFREIYIQNPVFGIIPRRLVGVLAVSFFVSAGMMIMWGRLAEADPTAFEQLARVTVVWAPGALGASLGDILPGESKGDDVGDLLEIGDGGK